MRAQEKLKDIAEGRLGPLLLKFSWPALVSMTLNALYNVVDRFYIGQGCGKDAIAGLALTFPVMMVFAAFGVLVGVGHGSLLSIKLGQGNRVDAEKTLGECVAFKLILFFLLPPLVWFNLDRLLMATGGAACTPGAMAAAKTYLEIVLFFHVFSHLAFGLSACMRAEGSARNSMMCMVVGFGANLVLDPIFIFGFGWGVAGAAWATNIAMILSCAWALRFYLGGHSAVRMRLGRIRVYRGLAGRALGIGLAPFLQQFVGAAIQFSLTMALAKWALDQADATVQLASLGIFQAVMMIFLMPMMGVQQGVAPILGYNWGARNYGRVRGALLLGFMVTSAVCVAACVLQLAGAAPLARCFMNGDDPALLKVAAGDLRLANCMLWCIGLNVVATTYFQSIGRPNTAIVLSLLRQGICLLPCIWILPLVFPDHTFGVWLALPVSDVLSCLTTMPPFFAHLRFLRRAEAAVDAARAG